MACLRDAVAAGEAAGLPAWLRAPAGLAEMDRRIADGRRHAAQNGSGRRGAQPQDPDRGPRQTGKTTLFQHLMDKPVPSSTTRRPAGHIKNWSYRDTGEFCKVEMWDVVDEARPSTHRVRPRSGAAQSSAAGFRGGGREGRARGPRGREQRRRSGAHVCIFMLDPGRRDTLSTRRGSLRRCPTR